MSTDAAVAHTAQSGPAPLVAHIIYRLDVGGLENGLVNLINRMPPARFRHAVISLTDATQFRDRIARPGIPVYCLKKPPGNSIATQVRLWRLLRRLRPAIVHTRNLASLECTVAAALAGRNVRIHGEHGRDAADPGGSNVRRQRIRRLFKPFVYRYAAVSRELACYLETRVGVSPDRITHLCNGVDTARFQPPGNGRVAVEASLGVTGETIVFGTVGRMEAVKDPLNLARAFIKLLDMLPQHRAMLRLAMVGDGPLRPRVIDLLQSAGVRGLAWVPGERNDIPAVMRGLDVFVLPSLGEGISNTVLEAMATGLPVIATRVGGNPELVNHGVTGTLVPPGDPDALAAVMRGYVLERGRIAQEGACARRIAVDRYGIDVMVRNYMRLYDEALQRRARPVPVQPSEVPLPFDGEEHSKG
jgi:sugar transferase (PEP-CTERM/EpsH1 system associated)